VGDAAGSIDTVTAGEVLAAAMDESPVCFGLIDRQLRLLFANRELGRLLGSPAEAQCLAELDGIAPAILDALRLAIDGGSVRDLEVPHAGRHHLVDCFPACSRAGEPVGASLLVRDITPWVAEREQVEAQQRIAGRLAAASTPEEVTAIMADAGVDVLGAVASAVALCDRDGGALRIVGGRGFPAETLQRWSSIDRDRDGPLAQCIRDRRPVFVEAVDAAHHPDLAQPAPGHVAWAAVPLISHQRVVGGLALSFDDAAVLATPNRDAILALARQCAQALERALLMSDISRTNQRLEAALEAGTMGWWEWDPQHDRVVWSASLERIYGLEPGSFGGRFEDYLALVHPDDREAVAARVAQGLSSDGHEFEHRVVTPGGAVRWVDGRGLVIDSADGSPPRMGGISIDVTDRKRDEIALRFLADASDLLSQSLDYRETLQRLAELAVPALADWCSVTISDGGVLHSVAVAHSDPQKVALVRALQRDYPPDPDGPNGAPAVIRSGRSEYLSDISDELLVSVAPDEKILGILRDLGLRSVITAPLTARGRTFGAISFVLAESGTNYQPRDLELAEELAHRAALAIDNARLFEERSAIADTLQASLLPAVLPAVPGFDIAAGYRPGGDGVEVGGDFYDLYATGEGRWQVVIGDVYGKGALAATLTGVTRHTARAAAVGDDRPDRVLAGVNAALRRTDTGGDMRFCTAAAGLLEIGPPAVISISRGGHPPPLMRRRSGAIEELGPRGTLLGVFDDPELHLQTTAFESGDMLVLYTDGVTDAWRHHGGDAKLGELIASLPTGVSAAEAVRRIEQAAIGARGPAGDDMAIVVLRHL
jgi:PAS domain S-box-containing protein